MDPGLLCRQLPSFRAGRARVAAGRHLALGLGDLRRFFFFVVYGSYLRYEAKAATPHLRMRPARWKARHTYASRAQCSRLSSTEQEVDLGPGTTKPRSRTRRLLKARWAPQPGGDREE